MHYSVLVVLGRDDLGIEEDEPEGSVSVDEAVEEALKRYQDVEWDWYQIGGRWTGFFDGYEPNDDPELLETCDLCGGTGDRATFRNEPVGVQHESGCNGCLGAGKRVPWPTYWPRRAEDAIPAQTLTEEHVKKVFAVVVHGRWFPSGLWVPWADGPGAIQEQPMPPVGYLKAEGHTAVIVDCHN